MFLSHNLPLATLEKPKSHQNHKLRCEMATTQTARDQRPTSQSTPSNLGPCGDPWGTVTWVRPADLMPGVLLALQPGAGGLVPHPGSQSSLCPTRCCQAQGKLPCLGPKQDRRPREPGGRAVRRRRGRAQKPRSGHGPRSWSVDTGWALGGCRGHVAPGQAESSLTRVPPHPNLTRGGSQVQDGKQEGGT